MPNNRQVNDSRRSALVLEARAGLIPTSDDVADERQVRMDRIGSTVKAYAKMARGGSGDCDAWAITNILADLRHHCDSKGLAFHELDAAAYGHYLEDVSESRGGIRRGL